MRDFPYLKGETARAFRLYAKYGRLVAPLQEAGKLGPEVASQEEQFTSSAQGRAENGAEVMGATTHRMVARGGLAVAGQRGDRRFLELVEALEKSRG